MTEKQIRDKMIEAGVKNVKEFGYDQYDQVDKDSILTDYMYGKVFLSMLKSGENITMNFLIEKVRLALIKEVEDNVQRAA